MKHIYINLRLILRSTKILLPFGFQLFTFFFGPYWIVQKIMLLEIMSVKWYLYRSTGERCHIYLNTRLFWRHDVHDFTRSVQSHTSRCSNLKCSGKPYYYFIGIVRSKGNASTDAQKCVFKALKERLSRARSMYFSYM